MKFCQSCSMPLAEEKMLGTEADGRPSEDYCVYCYANGKFTADITLEQMISVCVPFMVQSNPHLTEDVAREIMAANLPQLKRWSTYTRAEMEADAEKLLESTPIITLGSITENGYPRSCPLVRIANDGIRKIYVATSSGSKKVAHFRENPKAGVSFFDAEDGVTLVGTIRILDDSERLPYWSDWMWKHFPGGKESAEFCVLEFNTEEATFWLKQHFKTFTYD